MEMLGLVPLRRKWVYDVKANRSSICSADGCCSSKNNDVCIVYVPSPEQ